MSSYAGEGISRAKGPPKKPSKYGAMKAKKVDRLKGKTTFNSTSTMFVDNTISVPDNKKTMEAVAERLSSLIMKGEESVQGNMKVSTSFDEPEASVQTNVPSRKLLFEVINHIFVTGQLAIDCTIIALIYIDRLLSSETFCSEASAMVPVVLHKNNWRPILSVSFMVASKVWDDLSMINVDFSTFLPFSLKELNEWERRYLSAVKFNVRVGASVYAQYYFDIREFLQKKNPSQIRLHVANSARKPLDNKAAAKLEALSQEAQLRFIEYYGNAQQDAGGVLGVAAGDQSSALDNAVLGMSPKFAQRSKSLDESAFDGTLGSHGFATLS
jgi:hypothetical protein|eukprot:g2264.t1